jgi:hypothetical protein
MRTYSQNHKESTWHGLECKIMESCKGGYRDYKCDTIYLCRQIQMCPEESVASTFVFFHPAMIQVGIHLNFCSTQKVLTNLIIFFKFSTIADDLMLMKIRKS